ncbi:MULTISPECIES: hypothetical protein [Burkholderia]|uniref:hypothetical protein n=1 Tax=Burkholderia TaxID=32008 RepID=UPI00075DF3CF|nr:MULTISPECIES: hypothetical protein [Burkholderia]KVW79755.1 hypothetical protein WL00_30835 [Burkholderia cepacia]KVX76317.1 hypothetical protein WL07_03680 [Burkholderia cepacia]MBN3739052.1 hypothetical protein [Burkholderia sp. Tr-20355]RQS77404.1 hypothetical protein DF032_20620 [Burkholderia seminalis]
MSLTDSGSRFEHRLRQKLVQLKQFGWRHLMLSALLFTVTAQLYDAAMGGRRAAKLGDPAIRAKRAAVRAFLHHFDAVSVLEHALSGVGYALVGAALLQLFYFVYWPQTPQAVETPRWLRSVWIVVAAATAVVMILRVAYVGTGTAMAILTALGVAALLVRHARVAGVARSAPQWFIGIAGAAVWCNFDLAWKVSEWPTTHDTLGVVLAHLFASGATLIICSVAGGAVVRWCAWLRPVGT